MTIGDSSPAVTATIASSSSAGPRSTRPCSIEQRALLVHGEGEQVRVAEALADRGGLGGGGVRGLVVAGRLVLRDERAAAGSRARRSRAPRARAAAARGRASRSRGPSPRERGGEADPERAAHRAQRVAGVAGARDGRARGARRYSSSRPSMYADVASSSRSCAPSGGLVGARQRRRRPATPAGVGLAAPFEFVDHWIMARPRRAPERRAGQWAGEALPPLRARGGPRPAAMGEKRLAALRDARARLTDTEARQALADGYQAMAAAIPASRSARRSWKSRTAWRPSTSTASCCATSTAA